MVFVLAPTILGETMVLVREQGDYPLLTVNLLGCGGVIPNHMRLGRGGLWFGQFGEE